MLIPPEKNHTIFGWITIIFFLFFFLNKIFSLFNSTKKKMKKEICAIDTNFNGMCHQTYGTSCSPNIHVRHCSPKNPNSIFGLPDFFSHPINDMCLWLMLWFELKEKTVVSANLNTIVRIQSTSFFSFRINYKCSNYNFFKITLYLLCLKLFGAHIECKQATSKWTNQKKRERIYYNIVFVYERSICN